MLEPAPLILAFSAVVAVVAGRLLARRASLPVALLAATAGSLVAQAIGDGPLGGLLPLGGTAWPAPLVGRSSSSASPPAWRRTGSAASSRRDEDPLW